MFKSKENPKIVILTPNDFGEEVKNPKRLRDCFLPQVVEAVGDAHFILLWDGKSELTYPVLVNPEKLMEESSYEFLDFSEKKPREKTSRKKKTVTNVNDSVKKSLPLRDAKGHFIKSK